MEYIISRIFFVSLRNYFFYPPSWNSFLKIRGKIFLCYEEGKKNLPLKLFYPPSWTFYSPSGTFLSSLMNFFALPYELIYPPLWAFLSSLMKFLQSSWNLFFNSFYESFSSKSAKYPLFIKSLFRSWRISPSWLTPTLLN